MIRNIVRKLAKSRGYEIMGPPRAYAAQHSLAGVLASQSINLVLDAGANTGQFVADLRDCGYGGRVISFEPQSVAHEELRKKAAVDDAWQVADRMALGAEAGMLKMNISGNSFSSSLLQMLPAHSAAEPTSAYVAEEEVAVHRLDDYFSSALDDRVLLKIDVQGYEGSVLDGAPKVLAAASAVIVEMSLVPLYEGQVLALDMWGRLVKAGFEPWTLEPGFRDPASGRMLQLDGVFVRRQEPIDQ
jgi:FkbM family methyltransferase